MPSFLYGNGTFYPDGGIAPQVAVPSDGGTVVMSYPSLFIIPAGPLTTLSILLPANQKRGAMVSFMSTQAISTVFVQDSRHLSIIGAPSMLVANTRVTMQYVGGAGNTSWIWVH